MTRRCRQVLQPQRDGARKKRTRLVRAVAQSLADNLDQRRIAVSLPVYRFGEARTATSGD